MFSRAQPALSTNENDGIIENGRPKATDRLVVRRRGLRDISNETGGAVNAVRSSTAPGVGPPAVAIITPMVSSVRDYMNRPASDIDDRDRSNPNCATEIINEMFHRFKAVEQLHRINPEYMSGLPQLNSKMRRILVDWLTEIHAKFKMVPETLYLCINYLDRYLQVAKDVRRSKLQLIGVACMLIASKYEEIYPPSADQYVKITDGAYAKKEILTMEYAICGALQFQLTVPTAHSFMCRALKAANADSLAMVQLCNYITERSLQEYQMLAFPPSVIAAAAVSISRTALNRFPWSPTLLKYVGYDECDIAECISEMAKYLSTPPAPADQQTVYKKYSSSRYGNVAQTPLTF